MKTPCSTLTIVFWTLPLTGGCAPDLQAGDDDGPAMIDPMGGAEVAHEDEGEGVTLTRIDATSEDAWIYLDLADGAQLDVADPLADPVWDLGFQRFHIKLNGGASGPAGLEAAVFADTAFEDVDIAPAEGYLGDRPDGDDEDEQPDYVLRDWYYYDIMTHVLTPAPVVYVIRTGEGDHYKIQIDDYYDDAGTSAHMTFRWSRVDGPAIE